MYISYFALLVLLHFIKGYLINCNTFSMNTKNRMRWLLLPTWMPALPHSWSWQVAYLQYEWHCKVYSKVIIWVCYSNLSAHLPHSKLSNDPCRLTRGLISILWWAYPQTKQQLYLRSRNRLKMGRNSLSWNLIMEIVRLENERTLASPLDCHAHVHL